MWLQPTTSGGGGDGSGGLGGGSTAAQQRLVTASGESLYLWDVASQQQLCVAGPPPPPAGEAGAEHSGEPRRWGVPRMLLTVLMCFYPVLAWDSAAGEQSCTHPPRPAPLNDILVIAAPCTRSPRALAPRLFVWSQGAA